MQFIRDIYEACRAAARPAISYEFFTPRTEEGDRALLNLGHTFCHALESATGYSARLLHGEGVAIGCHEVGAMRLVEVSR